VHGLHWLARAREDRERRDAKDPARVARSASSRSARLASLAGLGTEGRETETGGVSDTGADTCGETGASSTATSRESDGGWSWGGAAKYLGIAGAAPAAVPDPVPEPNSTTTVADAPSAAGEVATTDAPGSLVAAMPSEEGEDAAPVDACDTMCRYDASEASASRRWSCAMRVAYALGDAGAPLLERAFRDPDPDPPEDAGSIETSPPPRERSVRVLCLDGGGIRGLATIVMLARIMRAAGAWCVGECFDLIVGTSTGGVIALGAGLLRLTLDEVGDLYDAMAGEVFKPDGYYDLLRRGPGHAAAKAFERVMSDMLGPEASQPLYAAAAHPRWYAAGARDDGDETLEEGGSRSSRRTFSKRRPRPPRVCLVSSLVSRQPSTLVLLRSYHRGGGDARAPHSGELPGEHRMGAVDALRATTAAPWYMEELAMEKELGLGRARPARDFGEEDDGAATSASVPSEETLNTSTQTRVGASIDARLPARDERIAHKTRTASLTASFGADARDASETETETKETGETSAFLSEEAAASEAVTSARDASRVESSLRFIDGAIACNNPTSVGIFEARALFGREVPLCVVSLGTGAAVPREAATRAQDIGNVMGNLVNATCDVAQSDALARHVLGGRDRYFRFQPVDDVFACELNDSAEATRRALREAARRYMDTDAVAHETRALAEALRE
jgi:hypothetical protein